MSENWSRRGLWLIRRGVEFGMSRLREREAIKWRWRGIVGVAFNSLIVVAFDFLMKICATRRHISAHSNNRL
jgi:hypothetical protein